MKCRRRRTQREKATLDAWNKQADLWNEVAYIWNPHARRYELTEVYQDKIARPMMNWFDRLPSHERHRMANSVDGE